MYAFLPSPKGVNYNCTAHLPILKVLYGVYIYYAEQRADPDRREKRRGGEDRWELGLRDMCATLQLHTRALGRSMIVTNHPSQERHSLCKYREGCSNIAR